MTDSLDLNLLTLYRVDGVDQLKMPGLKVAARPRRPARGREADALMLYMALGGNLSIPAEEQEKILEDLARSYYEFPGAVTSALRQTIERLNQILLNRNQKNANSGQQMVGMLTLLVLRRSQLYLAQSGAMHAYLITTDRTEHLYDPLISGRGLGLSQSVALRYYQADFKPNDTIIAAARPAPAWEAANLASLYGRELDVQRKRLAAQGAEINALLVQARPGSGKMTVLAATPLPSADQEKGSGEQFKAAIPAAGVVGASLNQTAPSGGLLPVSQASAELPADFLPIPELDQAGYPTGAADPGTQAVGAAAQRAIPVQAGYPPLEQAAAAPLSAVPARRKPGFFQTLGRGLGAFFVRLIPDDSTSAVSNTILAFFALAIPLVVVAVATAVYFRQGLAAQSEFIYAQALAAARQAEAQTEPLQRREALNLSIQYLNQADSYQQLPASQGLRLQVQSALDDLDLALRLDYQPAVIGGLPANIGVAGLVLSAGDLFVLDRTSGRVLRTFYTNQGYQIDPTFQCGPDAASGAGPLVDFSAWPAGNQPSASVLAMDAQGNLLFCLPEAGPKMQTLANPPNARLTNLKAFALDQNDLYVLDPANNAIWAYWSGDFASEPVFYFGEQIPQLSDVIDIAATNEDVYLLHADGHMTVCFTGTVGSVAPTRCTENTPYVDSRPGREGGALTPSTPYTQIQYSPPPDPSLFLGEASSQAVDRYSLRNLAFQKRYLPREILAGGPMSAFTVDTVERVIFLAAGNSIYYANLP